MLKNIQFKTKGMQRDLAVSAFSSEYAYENKNIRLQTSDNTLYSLVNEKGTKDLNINIQGIPIGQAALNENLIIFTADNNRKTTDAKVASFEDKIYKISLDGEVINSTELFSGNLNFNPKYPIETLSLYENKDLNKIYWVDGYNSPRMININAANIKEWTPNTFEFSPILELQEKITIEKSTLGSGSFAPGVLQYVFTYYNKYGQETNIFYTSPLLYTSHDSRGGSPEDKVSNSFSITISNTDKSFDYIRIYSILRTSINATPEVKRVADLNNKCYKGYSNVKSAILRQVNNPLEDITLYTENGESILLKNATYTYKEETKTYLLNSSDYIKLSSVGGEITWTHEPYSTGGIKDDLRFTYNSTNNWVVVGTGPGGLTTNPLLFSGKVSITSLSYIDQGTSGDSIDPTELLYVGGEDIIAGTIAQKDNTLFLGNITNKRKSLDSIFKNFFAESNISFSTKEKGITHAEASGYYPYRNQLNLDSYKIKFFKYLEWYRFGIQAQYKNGKWSNPIWLNDAQNTAHIDTGDYRDRNSILVPYAYHIIQDKDIINKFINNGYVKIRPVIVYPSLNDRECVCQGILCPTVYNVEDRFGNSPFVQSSWYVRPNAPFDITHSEETSDSNLAMLNKAAGSDISIYSRYGIMRNETTNIIKGSFLKTLDSVNKGSWVEFRHGHPVPSCHFRNGEIQCIYNPPESPKVSYTDSTKITEYVSNHSENYYIDQSIVTMHSPDIEFDDTLQHLDASKLKLRITGIVPLTSFIANVEITTTTPVIAFKGASELPMGFYKEPIGVTTGISGDFINNDTVGDSHFGYRALVSAPLWFDEMNAYQDKIGNDNKYSTGFVVYPWHRNGSLNNTKYNDSNGYRAALLDKKRMSNLRVSYKTLFLNNNDIWNAEEENNDNHTGISGVTIFNSNEISLVRIPAPKNSGLPDLNYYGNIDKLLTVSRVGDKKEGYPIIVSGVQDASTNAHTLFKGGYAQIDGKYTKDVWGVDPVRIKYKSTPHAVIALNYTKENKALVLPTLKEGETGYVTANRWSSNSVDTSTQTIADYNFWNIKYTAGVYQDTLDCVPSSYPTTYWYGLKYGWLWLGELYNDNIQNRFGGTTQEAFENNQWLPCGEAVDLRTSEGEAKDTITIEWIEGDTYYQRYDHIKTYPFTTEDQNQMTEIVSFMCETRVNLDGRYDKNRGQTNNLAITPTNFNKMNNVYSQENNFFTYRSDNSEKLDLLEFPNTITWTKTKTFGELTDTWTNITLASTLDLDGDKGTLNKLSRFNNEILAFQDKGISQILYNENMQISSTEGVPIEIANSGKVNGKRYIADKVGCTNKWSICETPSGIYFIDNITKGVYVFNGQINNLSNKLGFHSWAKQNIKMNIWNPIDFEGFVTYYDNQSGDIFFINSTECLAYSELIGQFTSFYSYESTPYFSNLQGRGLWIKNEKLWEHHTGDYNKFFGTYHPFYTTVIANPEMNMDKIFNTVEFRSDSWNDDTLVDNTFDHLKVWNEYQCGEEDLKALKYRPSNLKKKFRIWRANIPRDESNGRDRIRNPWVYIKLSKETENTYKCILHDIIVGYFV